MLVAVVARWQHARTAACMFRDLQDMTALPLAPLGQYLAAQGFGLVAPEKCRQFAGGLANRNYLLTLDSEQVVLRCPPAGPLAEGASDMAREAKVLGKLAPQFPPAPALRHFCADPAIIGVPFQLMAYRAGNPVGGQVPAAMAAIAGHRLRLMQGLLETLAALHRLDPAAIGLADLGKSSRFLERQLSGWARRAAAVYPEALPPVLQALIVHLRTHVPAETAVTLLHMDPKFDNLLFLPDLQVSAMIDWDMATRGDPWFDVAVLLSYWMQANDPGEVQALEQMPTHQGEWPTRGDVAQAYAALRGMPLPDLPWYLCLARLRLGVAWMQLYRLWQRGALALPHYASFAQRAEAIYSFAYEHRFDI